MISYPSDYNPIQEYHDAIESGAEVVGVKMKKTYRKIVRDMAKTTGTWYYSHSRANHALGFVENYCKHSKGKMGGKPVILELWEKAMIATIFGFIDIEGYRKYQRAVLIVGKKNGKSLIASAVALYLLVADGEPGPEIYAVATKKDQAKIIWQESKSMVKKSPALRKRIKPLVNELDCRDFNDGIYKALASDSDTLDGLNVHGVLMDEFHQWKNGRPLYDIMADGITARDQPLVFMTSTAGTIREDIYDQVYEEAEMTINGYEQADGYQDERSIFFIYELDSKSEWTNEACWKKANPGLGTIKNLSTLRGKVDKAKKNSDLVKNLVCKEFNIRETSTESWLSFDELNNTATYDIKELKPRYCIGGIDLASTTDLTCASILFQVPGDETIYIKQMYWLPEDTLEERANTDNVPYDKWVERGLMRTSQGNKVNYRDVQQWFVEIQTEFDCYISWIGYDHWSAGYFVEDMKNIFGTQSMEGVIQGKKTLSSPMKSLGADLKAKRINYDNNPITKWCLSNTTIDVDRNENIQPNKGYSKKKRIDGLASMLDAYVVYENHMEDYKNMI